MKTGRPSGEIGTAVEILGTGLSGASLVEFDGVDSAFQIVSDSFITTAVPGGANSGVVKVMTPGGNLLSGVFRVLNRNGNSMYVALLRGVNVGGKNLVPMKALVEVFVDAGCSDVSTYIQSGNVIFRAPRTLLKRLPRILTEKIAARFGFQVPVVLRSAEQLAATVAGTPFPNESLHVLFLADAPDANGIAKLDPDRSPPDRFQVSNHEVYLHLPNGAGNTKLTNNYFDSKLATKSTGRNWATVLKLLELGSRP